MMENRSAEIMRDNVHSKKAVFARLLLFTCVCKSSRHHESMRLKSGNLDERKKINNNRRPSLCLVAADRERS